MKTFGLSQPSTSAEWLKMNRSGSSKLSSFSLFRMIRSNALSASLVSRPNAMSFGTPLA